MRWFGVAAGARRGRTLGRLGRLPTPAHRPALPLVQMMLKQSGQAAAMEKAFSTRRSGLTGYKAAHSSGL